MNRKEKYADLAQWQETCMDQKRRYYRQTATFTKIPWTPDEDQMVLEHQETDTALSRRIGHSVAAIQKRRHTLKQRNAEQ